MKNATLTLSIIVSNVFGALGTAHADPPGAPAQIAAVIQAHLPQISGCYEQSLAANAALRGRLVARFAVDASGVVVGEPAVTGIPEAPALSACVAAQIQTLRFAPSANPMTRITYPFVFEPAHH